MTNEWLRIGLVVNMNNSDKTTSKIQGIHKKHDIPEIEKIYEEIELGK